MPKPDGTFTEHESGIINARDRDKGMRDFLREEIERLRATREYKGSDMHALYDSLEEVLLRLGEIQPGDPVK